MPIVPKIKYNGLNADGTEFYVEDVTGDYVGVHNEGGYGAPNLERSQVALHPVFTRVISDGTKQDVSIQNFNATTVTSFTGNYLNDGHINLKVFVMEIVASTPPDTTGYSEGDIRYDVANSHPIIVKDGAWVIAISDDLIASDLPVASDDELQLVKSSRLFTNLNGKLVDQGMEYDACRDDFHEYFNNAHDMMIVMALLESISIDFCRAKFSDENFLEVQKQVDVLLKKVEVYESNQVC